MDYCFCYKIHNILHPLALAGSALLGGLNTQIPGGDSFRIPNQAILKVLTGVKVLKGTEGKQAQTSFNSNPISSHPILIQLPSHLLNSLRKPSNNQVIRVLRTYFKVL